jgi:hypothetical protein
VTDERVQRLVDWVAQRQSSADVEIGPDTDLLATGILDSMGLVAMFFLVGMMGGKAVELEEAVAAGPITPASVVERYF